MTRPACLSIRLTLDMRARGDNQQKINRSIKKLLAGHPIKKEAP